MVGSYRFGSVEVDGEVYDHDMIYCRGKILRWWREKGHKVSRADVASLLEQPPDVVVFGTGAAGLMRVTNEAQAALEGAGIEVIAERTARAIERYNALTAEGRDIALAIHLTC